MKKIITKITLIVFILTAFMTNKSFGASAGISSTDKTVTSGTDSSVTVTVNSKVSLGSYIVTLTDTGGLELLNASGGEVSNSYKTVTSALASGTTSLASYSFKVPDVTEQKKYTVKFSLSIMEDTNCVAYDNTTNTATITVKPKATTTTTPTPSTTTTPSTSMPSESSSPSSTTTEEKTKSSNNYLSSISIIGMGALSPEFYRETYEYTVEYEDTVNLYELTEIQLEAVAEDDRATVKGTGTISLEPGENNITITVTAENGSERAYTIKVNKPLNVEQSDLRLKTLVLNGIKTTGEYETIDFTLDPEVFEYDLVVPYDISAISINPTTENEDIIIEKDGEDTLQEGENKIEITLISPSDKEIKTVYILNVQREAAPVVVAGLTNEQKLAILIGAVVLLILLIIIIVLIVKHKKKKKANNNEVDFIDNVEDKSENELDNKIDNDYENDGKKLNTVDDIDLPKMEWKKEEDNLEKANNKDTENKDIDEDEELEDKKHKKKKTGKRFI